MNIKTNNNIMKFLNQHLDHLLHILIILLLILMSLMLHNYIKLHHTELVTQIHHIADIKKNVNDIYSILTETGTTIEFID